MRETLHDSPSVLSSFQASPYYLSTAETEPEDDTLGFWGIQYKNCLKDRKDERYANMLRSGMLRHHLETVDKQANKMFRTIVEQEIVDVYCEEYRINKPRMKRRCARRDYLNLSKSKKRTAKKLRKGIRRQLQYIFRDIGFFVSIIRDNGIKVSEKYRNLLNTFCTLYEQQLYMLENNVHTVKDRIVSISQPWIRPIIRGKAHVNTEFGAKLHISMVNGYARIERLSFDSYNEAGDFFRAVGAYYDAHGCYPQRILVDKIYRNRETIAWCKEYNIQLAGPALGRPSRNQEVNKQAKKQECQDICDPGQQHLLIERNRQRINSRFRLRFSA